MNVKKWLIVSFFLIFAGAVVFTLAMSILKWDFSKFTTESFETNDYSFDESVESITVSVNTADVVILPTDSPKCSVVSYNNVKIPTVVTLNDGELVIEKNDTRKWYDYIGIGVESEKITVYLPHQEYNDLHVKSKTGNVEISEGLQFESVDISLSTGDTVCRASVTERIKIKASTGDITLSGANAGSLDLSVTTGNVTVSDVRCASLRSDGNTGDILMKNVIADGMITIERSTGDVSFFECDGGEISITTDTGDVFGSLISNKVFFAHSSTGDVDVPKTMLGGKCEIVTDTGNINIKIQD